MRLILLCVGRSKAGADTELSQRYIERANAAGRALGFPRVELRELDESRAREPALRKAAEAKAILASLSPGARLIALDENGALASSREFSTYLGKTRDQGASVLTLVIGGADGLGPDVLGAASLVLSFGRMTFPHQLVRVMAAEQLYRAMTILAGHPYHRD
ncbi:23S rRNA (pseudouridine(1915)-N(3))-methyltransferase RlmH [Methylocella silvestris]|uniref:Ribosomal RNA large subunit methyltransferase H n=1 Tax=Methylocella silvestris TaxID=199596 RepID=A0A2J7TGX0_METSI|nr:23S rRNA (pseudouridine(1915)-N(3))-methyltransferase RlmH [Methylocella silvestris]PNG25999.1 23S rRNA (pseudouridine(1915)-N(3))-methyltransferase RlmH [Methylocella silvestris]